MKLGTKRSKSNTRRYFRTTCGQAVQLLLHGARYDKNLHELKAEKKSCKKNPLRAFRYNATPLIQEVSVYLSCSYSRLAGSLV